jgi:hypothetical protein
MAFTYARLARTIVARVHELGEGGELRALVEACGDEDAVEYVLDERKSEQRLASLLRNLLRLLNDYEERRMIPPLGRSDTSPTFFVYRFADDLELGEDERDLLARYRLQHELLELLRNLDPNAFEHLCGRILAAVGCTHYYVTRMSQDQGVDCFGRLPAAARTPPGGLQLAPGERVLGGLSFLLFAQAKRYGADNPVDVNVIRDIEGAWRDIENRRGDRELPVDLARGLQEVGYRSADPVLLMVMATSSFTGPAEEAAKSLGVVTLDGEQIGQFMLENELGVERLDLAVWRTDEGVVLRFCLAA